MFCMEKRQGRLWFINVPIVPTSVFGLCGIEKLVFETLGRFI